jgi:hypothetical protein
VLDMYFVVERRVDFEGTVTEKKVACMPPSPDEKK